MNRKIIGMVISIVAVALIAFVVVFALRQSAPENNAVNDSAGNQQEEGTPSSGNREDDTTQGSSDETLASTQAEVEIDDMAFQAASITVKRGTVVTWTNKDDVAHNVVSEDGAEGGPQSETLSKNQTYSFTFNEVGTFNYICSFHLGMKGAVKVVD